MGCVLCIGPILFFLVVYEYVAIYLNGFLDLLRAYTCKVQSFHLTFRNFKSVGVPYHGATLVGM